MDDKQLISFERALTEEGSNNSKGIEQQLDLLETMTNAAIDSAGLPRWLLGRGVLVKLSREYCDHIKYSHTDNIIGITILVKHPYTIMLVAFGQAYKEDFADYYKSRFGDHLELIDEIKVADNEIYFPIPKDLYDKDEVRLLLDEADRIIMHNDKKVKLSMSDLARIRKSLNF